jgi:hypothetical protein
MDNEVASGCRITIPKKHALVCRLCKLVQVNLFSDVDSDAGVYTRTFSSSALAARPFGQIGVKKFKKTTK